MGRAKEMQLQAVDRGFAWVDGYVCAGCVDDPALKEYIEIGADGKKCDYCGRTGDQPVAADANDVVDHIAASIKTEYALAVDELGWEGEYIGTHFHTEDLLDFELDQPLGDGAFAAAVKAAATDEHWCERDYYATKEDEALRYDWDLFVQTVKHGSRFMFLRLDEAPPDEEWIVGHAVRRGNDMLAELARLIERHGLIRHLSAGQVFYRCRTSTTDETYSTAKDLGTPPPEKAMTNRMSAAGIAMFYGASDEETAIVETAQLGDAVASVGKFVTDDVCAAGIAMFYGASDEETAIVETAQLGDAVASVGKFVTDDVCSVIDLDKIPEIPSIFDDGNGHKRRQVRFLHRFRNDLSKPIRRDGREHIEYVPTQIVTEYLRLIYRLPEEGHPPLNGLVFTSSRSGGQNVVFYVTGEACLEQDEDPEAEGLHLRLESAHARDLSWPVDAGPPRPTHALGSAQSR